MRVKDRMRDLEQVATDDHLARLREGRTPSNETRSLQIEIARNLKPTTSPLLPTGSALRSTCLVLDDNAERQRHAAT